MQPDFSGIDRADADAVGGGHLDQGVVRGHGAIDAFDIGLPGQDGDFAKRFFVKARSLAGDFTEQEAIARQGHSDIALIADIDGGRAADEPRPQRFVSDEGARGFGIAPVIGIDDRGEIISLVPFPKGIVAQGRHSRWIEFNFVVGGHHDGTQTPVKSTALGEAEDQIEIELADFGQGGEGDFFRIALVIFVGSAATA